jgi:branched-chain amino acid transport system ATP-binding protein
MLALNNVLRAFGGVRAVDDASFTVERGEVHGLIGPNGAGKTTLLNLISGFIAPTSGTISFEGRSVGGLAPQRLAALGISRTYQNIRLFSGLTALDNVVVGHHLQRTSPFWRRLFLLPSARREEAAARTKALEGLERVGLRERALTTAATLSYGEQRRVEIARALGAGPKLLLLDEPTAGMNPAEAAEVARLVREVAREGRSVLLVEHNVRLVMELCDRITVLNFGKVIARGTPLEVARDPAVIAAYLGDEGSGAGSGSGSSGGGSGGGA